MLGLTYLVLLIYYILYCTSVPLLSSVFRSVIKSFYRDASTLIKHTFHLRVFWNWKKSVLSAVMKCYNTYFTVLYVIVTQIRIIYAWKTNDSRCYETHCCLSSVLGVQFDILIVREKKNHTTIVRRRVFIVFVALVSWKQKQNPLVKAVAATKGKIIIRILYTIVYDAQVLYCATGDDLSDIFYSLDCGIIAPRPSCRSYYNNTRLQKRSAKTLCCCCCHVRRRKRR